MLETPQGETHERILPALATLLHFSPEEVQRARSASQARASQVWGIGSTALGLGGIGGTGGKGKLLGGQGGAGGTLLMPPRKLVENIKGLVASPRRAKR